MVIIFILYLVVKKRMDIFLGICKWRKIIGFRGIDIIVLYFWEVCNLRFYKLENICRVKERERIN